VKRRHVHLLFGLSLLAFSLLAGYQVTRLKQAERVNQAIAHSNAGALGSALPEALFARAVLLSQASAQRDQAVKIYKEIIQGGRPDLRQAALFNLGNLHMREALASNPADSVSALPLIELAKRSYRDLLREHPEDWDARYNLERALWLAPEIEDARDENDVPPWQRRLIIMPDTSKVDLP